MSVSTIPSTFSAPSTGFLNVTNQKLDILFGVICCFAFTIGTIGNCAAFFFFKYSKSNVPHSVYKIITLADFSISICILPVGVCFLTDRSPGLFFGNTVLCHAWGYTWNMAGRLSIFLVVVLSTTRTCLVLWPFYVVRLRVLIIAITVYFVFLFVQLLLIELRLHGTVEFKAGYAECVFYTSQEITYPALYFIGYTLPFIIPMFVVFASCGCTTYAIFIKPRQSDSHTAAQAASHLKVTVTILIFTLVYSIFNIPLVFDRILLAFRDLYDFKDPYTFQYVDYYLNFTYSTSVAINSALNPLLYLWRMANFRKFLYRFFLSNRRFSLNCKIHTLDCSLPISFNPSHSTKNTKKLFEVVAV